MQYLKGLETFNDTLFFNIWSLANFDKSSQIIEWILRSLKIKIQNILIDSRES